VALLKPDQQPIGYVQATILEDRRALIAYEFGSAWWGRGLASESVAVMVDHLARAFDVRTVGAVFKRGNLRSRRLLQRVGMVSAAEGEFPATGCEGDEDAMVLRISTTA
jgi:RimJ/RimL family protein N-acetyltransferase